MRFCTPNSMVPMLTGGVLPPVPPLTVLPLNVTSSRVKLPFLLTKKTPPIPAPPPLPAPPWVTKLV